MHDGGYEGSVDGSDLDDEEEIAIEQDDEHGLDYTKKYATNNPFIEECFPALDSPDISLGISQEPTLSHTTSSGGGEVIYKFGCFFLLMFSMARYSDRRD